MSKEKRESVSSERSAMSDAPFPNPPTPVPAAGLSLPIHRSATDNAIRYDANEEVEEVLYFTLYI